MVLKLHEISGLGPYDKIAEEKRTIYRPKDLDKAFLIENPHTIELRTDSKLGKLLAEKYESVMKSRYFGNQGIEIVMSNQLSDEEISDLIRLSYNLTSSLAE